MPDRVSQPGRCVHGCRKPSDCLRYDQGGSIPQGCLLEPESDPPAIAMGQRVYVVFGSNPATGQVWLVDIWSSQDAADSRANRLNSLRDGVENGHRFHAESRRVWEVLDD